MHQVIITGADGFLGSHTTAYFLEQGINVLALGRERTPRRLKKHAHLRYLPCDIQDQAAMRAQIPAGVYDTFLHFAWEGSAGAARMDYPLQMQNALHTVECMKTAQALGCTRFVGAGSMMEYEVEAAMHAPGSRPGMGYLYGMGKHSAHAMCQSVAAASGMELVWPMMTNAYGVGEQSPRFINATLRKILHGEPLRFTSAQQHYDFVYVTDAAKAFYLIAKNGKPFHEYLIGSAHARPLKQLILEIKQEVAPQAELLFGDVPFTGIHLPLSVFDTSATERDCGFQADISFAQGIRMTMDWLKTV